MMTRKNYEELAHILDANVAPLGIVFDTADYLGEDNPRFDRARFVLAATKNLRDSQVRTLRMIEKDVLR